MKTDPSELFRDADRVNVPDLWDDITVRHPTPGTPTATRRIAVAAASLIIGLGSTLVLVQAFQGGTPSPSPEPATQTLSPSRVAPHMSGVIPVTGSSDVVGESVVGAGSLWVETFSAAGGTGGVERIDPSSGRSLAHIPLPGQPAGLVFGLGSLWVETDTNGDAQLQRIDPATNAIDSTIPVGGGRGGLRASMVIDPTGIWVWSTDQTGARIMLQVNPDTDTIGKTIPLGPAPHWGNFGDGQLVSAEGWIWALDWNGNLIKIDPQAGVVRDTFPVGGYAMVAGDGSLWVDVQPEGTRRGMLATSYVQQIDPTTGTTQGQPFPVTRGPDVNEGSASPLAYQDHTLWMYGFSGQQGLVTIDAVDVSKRAISDSIQLPLGQTSGVTFSSDEQRIWVSGSREVVRVDLRAPDFADKTPGARCDETSPGGSTPSYSATSGLAGSMITVSGWVPHFLEDGTYMRGDTLQWWWNVKSSGEGWALLTPGSTQEPVPASLGPILLLGEANPGWACSYQVTIAIPNLPPGRYEITSLQVWSGGLTLMADPVSFTISG